MPIAHPRRHILFGLGKSVLFIMAMLPPVCRAQFQIETQFTWLTVPSPQAATCVGLNLTRGGFYMNPKTAMPLVQPNHIPPEDGFCVADQISRAQLIEKGQGARNGDLVCPSVSFIPARIGEALCGIVDRQAAGAAAHSAKIDVLDARLTEAEKAIEVLRSEVIKVKPAPAAPPKVGHVKN